MTRETISFNPLSSSEQEQFNAALSDWPEMARFGKVRNFLSNNLWPKLLSFQYIFWKSISIKETAKTFLKNFKLFPYDHESYLIFSELVWFISIIFLANCIVTSLFCEGKETIQNLEKWSFLAISKIKFE